jgi:hypothetical protein
MTARRWSLKNVAAIGFMIVVQLIILDILTAYVLFYFYQLKGLRSPDVFYSVDGRPPMIWAARRVYLAAYYRAWPYSESWPRLPLNTDQACASRSIPSQPFHADPTYGRRIRPGTFVIESCPTLAMRPAKNFRWSMTVDADGGRRTAYAAKSHPRRIYLLGDSYVFGWALNDEQIAAWLLQGYFADQYTVKNFAGGGWGTTEELITIRNIADQLRPDDVVILGYASYYKIRNVAAPDRVRFEASIAADYGNTKLRHSRARVSNSSVTIDFVPLDCNTPEKYCDQPSPSPAVADETTIAMYREILDRVKSRIAVLYLRGSDDDPVLAFLKQRKVAIIDGRPDRAKYFMNDDVAGYDTHPGTIANYEWFKMMRTFVEQGQP